MFHFVRRTSVGRTCRVATVLTQAPCSELGETRATFCNCQLSCLYDVKLLTNEQTRRIGPSYKLVLILNCTRRVKTFIVSAIPLLVSRVDCGALTAHGSVRCAGGVKCDPVSCAL